MPTSALNMSASPSSARTTTQASPNAQPWAQADWLLLFILTALAALLRFYKLGVVPPGFQFDEAFNAIDAGQVLHGNTPLFLPANGGREVLYTYFQAALGWLFGLNVYTLRLASALLGTLTVPATYWLLRCILQRQSQAVATFTSLTLAVSLWHLHFSHYGIRVITMPLLYCGLFGMYWLGVHGVTRRQRLVAFVISGLLTGLSVWTNPTGRFVPFILIAYTLFLLWQDRRWRGLALDRPLGGLFLSGVVALIVFLPLGLEFYRHPDWFTGHAAEVSVFAERVGGDSPAQALLRNVLTVLGMFSWRGDGEWIHNLAGRPVFDPLLSLPFVIGLGLWVQRLWQRRADDPDVDALALLGLWAFVMLSPSVLSDAAPNFSRTLPALPAIFVAVGLGLSWMVNLSQLRAKTTPHPTPTPLRLAQVAGEGTVSGLSSFSSLFKHGWGLGLALGVVAISGWLAFYDYFVRFPQQPAAYYAYDADKLDALNYLNGQAAEYEVYLQPLWADHPPVRFLRSSRQVKALDTVDALVLPPAGRAALYSFPAERADQAAELVQLWPGLAVEEIPDRFGNLMLAQVRVPAELAADWPPMFQPTTTAAARFDDAPMLLGMQNQAAGEIAIFWQAEQTTLRNLTTFIHLINQDGQRVGQIDKLPGNGSYQTPAWSPGERVIDRYQPEITDPCAGGEAVQVLVGWYELAANGTRRPRLDGSGDTALAGEMTLPWVARPADQVPLPNSLNLPIADRLTLTAAAVQGGDWQASAPLTVDLYWQGDPAATTEIALDLANQTTTIPLWAGELAPGAKWEEGAVLCRRLRLRLPTELAPGSYALQVGATQQPVAFYDLTVGPSTRQFDPPPLSQAVDATFGEAIRLLGYTTTRPADLANTLAVTLVWQAQAKPQASYPVFVHLLDANGQIVAQSDKLPNGGYTTDRWVAGEVVSDTYQLNLPASLPPGSYQLAVGLYDAVSGQRLPGVDGAGQGLVDGVVTAGTVELP